MNILQNTIELLLFHVNYKNNLKYMMKHYTTLLSLLTIICYGSNPQQEASKSELFDKRLDSSKSEQYDIKTKEAEKKCISTSYSCKPNNIRNYR